MLNSNNKTDVKILDHEETKNESIALVRYETSQNATPAKTLLKPIINASQKPIVLVDLDDEENNEDDHIKT